VLVTARRMTELKVVDPASALKAPEQITETVRTAQAPEFADQRLVALPKSREPRVAPGQDELPVAEASGGAGR
jgi:hypothetical protein